MCVCVPGAQRLQFLHMRARVSGVIDEHRAIAQTGIYVGAVVQTPAAAPHWFTCIIRLNHRVGQKTATHTNILVSL